MYLTHTPSQPSLEGNQAGPQGRNLKAEPRRNVAHHLALSMAPVQLPSLTNPGPPAQGWGRPQWVWARPHQSAVKTIPHRCGHRWRPK